VSIDEALNLPVLDPDVIQRVQRAGSWRTPLVASDAVRVVLLRQMPGEEPHPPHLHPEAEEILIVTGGMGGFSINRQPEVLAGPPSILYVPRGVVHRIRVPGPEALEWLSIVAPNFETLDAVDVVDPAADAP
jgi:mannose-6-phosphate isomerase-like protein (cupin superfamily)